MSAADRAGPADHDVPRVQPGPVASPAGRVVAVDEPVDRAPERPVASVVVPTHRGAHRLPVLLAALAAQDVEQPWELLVALDGEFDDTLAVLERLGADLPLRVRRSRSARGLVATLNDAMSAARGSILVRCDDDLTPGPDFVRRHVEAHGGRTDRGVIALTRDVFPDTPYARAYGRAATERARRAASGTGPEHRWVHWAACNSVHRDAWARVGGFDPRFGYGQDAELGWRLHRAGVELVVRPELELEHRGPATTATTRVPRAFVAGASRRLFAQVHPQAHRAAPAPPHGAGQRTWSVAVAGLAGAARRRDDYRRIGRALDRVLAVLPPRVGHRLVALAIEAAAVAGERHGSTDLAGYRDQKSAEHGVEVRRAPSAASPSTRGRPTGPVTVVVPHHGDPAPTRALIAQLAGRPQVGQIVVVDDGSPTPLPDLPGAQVVRRAVNGGFGSAVNTGAAHASQDLLLVLNSDVHVGPDTVAALVAAAAPWQPAVVGPQVRHPDGHQAPTARRFPRTRHQVLEWLTPLARWRHTGWWHRAVGHDATASGTATTVVDWLVGAALLVPTADFRAVGGFDERYFMNSEEIDLQRRLRARGLPSVYAGAVIVTHRGGGSSDPQQRRAWLVAARLQYAARRGPGARRRLRLALTAATGVNLVANAVRRATGTPVDPIATARAELDLLRDHPDPRSRPRLPDNGGRSRCASHGNAPRPRGTGPRTEQEGER